MSNIQTRLNPEQFVTIVENLAEPVITIDRDFQITSFNKAAEQVTGYPRAVALGRPCREVLHSTVCDHIEQCPVSRLIDERATNGRELYVPGTVAGRNVRLKVRLLRDAGQAVVGAVEEILDLPIGEAVVRPAPETPRTDCPAPHLNILDESERRAIEETLRRHNWNRSTCCEELGLSRTTLWRKMRKLGIATRRLK